MTEPEPQKLSRHIETPLDDARVERQWAAIQEAGLPDGAGRARRLGAGLWLGAAAVAADMDGNYKLFNVSKEIWHRVTTRVATNLLTF